MTRTTKLIFWLWLILTLLAFAPWGRAQILNRAIVQFYVAPRIASLYVINGSTVDSELCGYLIHHSTILQESLNSQDFLLIKNREPIFGSHHMRCASSSLAIPVVHVGLVGTCEQMFRIDAPRIVAGMANIKASMFEFWMMDFIGDNVSAKSGIKWMRNIHKSVAGSSPVCDPNPTISKLWIVWMWGSILLIDFGPKAVKEFFRKSLARLNLLCDSARSGVGHIHSVITSLGSAACDYSAGPSSFCHTQ